MDTDMAHTKAAAAEEISRAFVDLMRASRGGHDKPHGEALRTGIETDWFRPPPAVAAASWPRVAPKPDGRPRTGVGRPNAPAAPAPSAKPRDGLRAAGRASWLANALARPVSCGLDRPATRTGHSALSSLSRSPAADGA